MNLPNVFHEKTEWVIVGPQGPALPPLFSHLPVLAVDGGIKQLKRFDYWIGDGDSGDVPLSTELVQKLPQNKDASDLAHALRLFPQKNHYTLHFWGFTGGRQDHELFVLGEIHRFLQQTSNSRCFLYQSNAYLHLAGYSAGDWDLELQGLFSLAVVEKASLSMTGKVAYPVPLKTDFHPLSSLGLSNQGSGPVHIDSDGPFFLLRSEQK